MAGGWGAAALAGTQSRDHRDLDLAVDADDLSVCLRTLEGLGYQRETDWLPVRVEDAAPGRGWVDVHPVAFDDSGDGRQADLDGGWFAYPPSAFTVGALHGRPVPCLSTAQQRVFHAGYEPPASGPARPGAAGRPRRLRFTGSGIGLFESWVKWWLLCLVRLGTYRFWVIPRLTKMDDREPGLRVTGLPGSHRVQHARIVRAGRPFRGGETQPPSVVSGRRSPLEDD